MNPPEQVCFAIPKTFKEQVQILQVRRDVPDPKERRFICRSLLSSL